jgi:hypothetical protein
VWSRVYCENLKLKKLNKKLLGVTLWNYQITNRVWSTKWNKFASQCAKQQRGSKHSDRNTCSSNRKTVINLLCKDSKSTSNSSSLASRLILTLFRVIRKSIRKLVTIRLTRRRLDLWNNQKRLNKRVKTNMGCRRLLKYTRHNVRTRCSSISCLS